MQPEARRNIRKGYGDAGPSQPFCRCAVRGASGEHSRAPAPGGSAVGATTVIPAHGRALSNPVPVPAKPLEVGGDEGAHRNSHRLHVNPRGGRNTRCAPGGAITGAAP
jgi:hypothetical protein